MKLFCLIYLVFAVSCISTISAEDSKIQCESDNLKCTVTGMTPTEFSTYFKDDEKAKNLKQLTMSKVDISSIEFNKFTSLEDLSCTNCEIAELKSESFKSLGHMKKMDFSNNKITKLPAELLINSPNLEVVNFEKNNIDEIPPKFFQKLNKLKLVKLSDNKLVKIVATTFEIAENVATELEVELNNNHITELFIDKNVVIMRANNNTISKLECAPSRKITELYLDHNQLTDTALECLKNLKELSVTGNPNLNTSLKKKDHKIIADKTTNGCITFSPTFLLKILSVVLLINLAYN